MIVPFDRAPDFGAKCVGVQCRKVLSRPRTATRRASAASAVGSPRFRDAVRGASAPWIGTRAAAVALSSSHRGTTRAIAMSHHHRLAAAALLLLPAFAAA